MGSIDVTVHVGPRDQCAAVLSRLGLHPPLTLAEIVRATSRYTGRRIRVRPEPLAYDQLFGMTSTDGDVDVVRYQSRTSATHQLTIVLHELVHLLMDHPRRPVPFDLAGLEQRLPDLGTDLLHLVIPDLPAGPHGADAAAHTPEESCPGLLTDFREALGSAIAHRSTSLPPAGSMQVALYDDHIEWEAETMATIMLEWITTDESRPRTRRARCLRESLGGPDRWAHGG